MIYESITDSGSFDNNLTSKKIGQESGVFSSSTSGTGNSNNNSNQLNYFNNTNNNLPNFRVDAPPPSPLPHGNQYGVDHVEHADSSKYFGPATKDHYSEMEWGIVTTQNNSNSNDDSLTYTEEEPRFRSYQECV